MTERRVFVYRRRGGRGEAAPQKSLAPETARGEEEEEQKSPKLLTPLTSCALHGRAVLQRMRPEVFTPSEHNGPIVTSPVAYPDLNQ